MSTNFYLKSIKFNNYRGLKSLKIPRLRRINLIGGYNGTGKSTLLEGIFLLLDRRSPGALTRSYDWRKVASNKIDYLFLDQDKNKPIEIIAETTDGKHCITLTYGEPPTGVSINIPAHNIENQINQQISGSSHVGINVNTVIDGQPDDASFWIPTKDGFLINTYRIGLRKIPLGIIVTAVTRNTPQVDAERYSEIVRNNKQNELYEMTSILRPNLKAILLLQDNNNPCLYGQLDNGDSMPIAMLGDGLQTILSIAMNIMHIPGGILFLDEFDSTIHYSILDKIWISIAKLANKYNCQIFAVTHSRECIEAAARGLNKQSQINDLQYIRLEKNHGEVEAVSYTGQEIIDASEGDWEIR